MIDWFFLILLILIPSIGAFKGKQISNKKVVSRKAFYLKDIISILLFLIIILLIKPSAFEKIDFQKIGKGFTISKEIVSGIMPVFFVPFFLSFFKNNNIYPKNILDTKEFFGIPIDKFPNSMSEWWLFGLYILLGVVFEELICRQFMFYSLNEVLGLKGDSLLLISSFFFAIGHLYQGVKGILTALILGLILGKLFQIQENILYPILLHLFLNITVLPFAIRRIKELKKRDVPSNKY
ncbi:MAG TPA: CPBP family intramembrane glutamic endopeptidase [Chitinophagaceae bacterium]|nr:CPBP family intramembrane glutamic endopeptidase [Chitinophagaceae bacterium]